MPLPSRVPNPERNLVKAADASASPRPHFPQPGRVHIFLCPELRLIPSGEPRHRALHDIWLAIRAKPSYVASVLLLNAAMIAVFGLTVFFLQAYIGLSGPAAGWSGFALVLIGFRLQALPVWLLWRRESRRIASEWARLFGERVCPRCGYRLRSNLGPCCPECGTIVPFPDRADKYPESGAT